MARTPWVETSGSVLEVWRDQQPTQRVVGKRCSPELSRTPMGPSAGMRQMLQECARTPTHCPKGVFRYGSATEANQDRDRWTVEAIVAAQSRLQSS